MKQILLFMLSFPVISYSGCTQSSIIKSENNKQQRVGGACEGCEAIHESPVPFEKLSSVAILPDFNEAGPKLEISGIVYQHDGKTPAKDVVLYVYHTDQTGIYPTKGGEKGWEKRHGYIRGWIKTDRNGYYKFYTLRPAAYPNRHDPAHIHISIKEPDKNEYWADAYLFDDDPLLTAIERKRQENRGGNGILNPVPQSSGVSAATRDIILGLNVPGYPNPGFSKIKSGLTLGSNCPAFDPLHLSGADKGKNACPMCKYGYGQGIMLWFNHSNLDQMNEFAKNLETEMEKRGEKKFRVFLVYMNPSYKENNNDREKLIIQEKIRTWCENQGLDKVAMTWIPSPLDTETAGLYKINPEARNTVFVYKKRKVVAKWVNIEYNNETLETILKII